MIIDRREFFKIGKNITLVSIAAFSFGCSIKPLVKNKNKKIALIYATRYGSTKDTAQWISQGLDRDIDLWDIKDISNNDIVKEYDMLIIGSGVWIDGVDKKLLKFLASQNKEIKDKVIASFIVCGTTKKDKSGKERIEQYFRKFHEPLDKRPVLNEYFGGRLIIDRLNEKDRILLENFYKKVLKRKFVSWDRTDPKKAIHFGNKMKINWKTI